MHFQNALAIANVSIFAVPLLALLAVSSVSASSDVEPLGNPGGLEGSLDLDLQDYARDKLAGRARIGSKTGWSRHKLLHHHKPHQHINIKDCTDVTEKFQTVDAACKTTKQAFAAARAMVRYAPLSDGEPRWEMLRHCASLKELTVEIPVGSSESNAKTVSLPSKLRMGGVVVKTAGYAPYFKRLRCPAVVSKQNWGNTRATYGDTFSAVWDGTSLAVRRTDSNGGWGMGLVVKCTVQAPGVHREDDWRIKGAKMPFACTQVVATVTCPCASSDGSPMSFKQASASIIGQVNGVDADNVDLTPGSSIKDRQNWGVPWPSFLTSLKTSVGVTKMAMCWGHRCAAKENSKVDELLEEMGGAGPLEQLDLQQAVAAGVGWDCG